MWNCTISIVQVYVLYVWLEEMEETMGEGHDKSSHHSPSFSHPLSSLTTGSKLYKWYYCKGTTTCPAIQFLKHSCTTRRAKSLLVDPWNICVVFSKCFCTIWKVVYWKFKIIYLELIALSFYLWVFEYKHATISAVWQRTKDDVYECCRESYQMYCLILPKPYLVKSLHRIELIRGLNPSIPNPQNTLLQH